MTRAEPPRLLEYTLGGDRLVWELEPSGAGLHDGYAERLGG